MTKENLNKANELTKKIERCKSVMKSTEYVNPNFSVNKSSELIFRCHDGDSIENVALKTTIINLIYAHHLGQLNEFEKQLKKL